MLEVSKPESVRDLIDRQAIEHPNKLYLIQPDTELSVSFSELQQRASSIAHHIAEQGITPGDSVAYAMANGHSCAMTVLGIMYGGYRAVAINLVAGRDVIAYVLAHSQTALVFTQNEHTQLLSDALSCEAYAQERAKYTHENHADLQIIKVSDTDTTLWRLDELEADQRQTHKKSAANTYRKSDAHQQGQIDAHKQSYKHEDKQSHEHEDNQSHERKDNQSVAKTRVSSQVLQAVRHSDDALLMYTSGTTGRPKGVTLSHASVIAGGRNVAVGHQLTSSDRALCVLPLYHINGLCVTLFGPLVSASSLVLPHKFSTSEFWTLVDDHRCSWFSVVPTQIAYLLRDADVSQLAIVSREFLRFGRSASAPLSPDVHLAFEQRFGIPLIETMGLTESAAQILSNPMPPLQRKHGSPGLPVGCEVIIVDTHLQPVAAGVEGELLVRGANIMNRYFRNESVTTETLVNGGWLRTGDLGRKDADGFVFITGRLKELIIKGGENIAPREIDDALYQYTDVVEAAAFACPCDDFGQRVEAAVVLKMSSELSEADLIAGCEQRVGRFKCPDKIHFMQELPKGPSGKIQRAKIHQLVIG